MLAGSSAFPFVFTTVYNSLQDLLGARVIKGLSSLIRKPSFPLPHGCIKSGSALLVRIHWL